jgi:twinfilin-like protein
MLYSSGSSSVFQRTKFLLSTSPSSVLYSRKIETSDPKELTERFLVDELGFAGPGVEGEKVSFAKPRGPARRRQ